jgi:AcrR family transcriptional regulator
MTATTRKNISRSEWLTLALDALGEAGRSRLHLDSLIALMPVSKGSFYHHFRNKREFLTALVEHWDDTQTQVVVDAINQVHPDSSPQEKLWLLMTQVESQQLNRYEQIMRSLSLEDEVLAAMVAMIDHKRLLTVERLFGEMGFTGIEQQVRTRAFVITTSLEGHLLKGMSPAEREKHLRARHAFFIRP